MPTDPARPSRPPATPHQGRHNPGVGISRRLRIVGVRGQPPRRSVTGGGVSHIDSGGFAAGAGENPCRAHRRGLRLPRLPHPADAETRNEQVPRLHHTLPEIGTEGSGPGAGQDVQINPEHGSGRADRRLEPVLAGMGELLPARGVQGNVRHDRQIDNHAWLRLVGWIHRKHRNINRKQLRRRFCNRGWRIAHNGVEFTGASSVAVTRYRYRGANIPTPWTQAATSS